VPERAAGMIHFVHVPSGFWSRGVVPYDPELQALLPVAQIGHERSGYQFWEESAQLDVRDAFA